MMTSIQIRDPFITTLIETQFHNDKDKFIEMIKGLFTRQTKIETYEYNLLKAYSHGELSLGQVATILDLTKLEVMDLLEKYDIPYVEADEEYMQQEFNAFS